MAGRASMGERIGWIELARLLREIFEDRARFTECHGRSTRALMIDDRRDLVAWTDLHELRRHLRLFPDIDGNDLVGEPSLLEHHSRLVAVVRRPRVAIDHFILPMSTTGKGLPHLIASASG